VIGDALVELAPLVVNGDGSDLGWRPFPLGRAQPEVVEDLLDGGLIRWSGDPGLIESRSQTWLQDPIADPDLA
jgi:hypothetical protein